LVDVTRFRVRAMRNVILSRTILSKLKGQCVISKPDEFLVSD
jgi:hypothetical protein